MCYIVFYGGKYFQLQKENNEVCGIGLYLVFYLVVLKLDFYFVLLLIFLKLKENKLKEYVFYGIGNFKFCYIEEKEVI